MKPSAGVFLTQDFGRVTRDLVLMAGDQIVKMKDLTPDPEVKKKMEALLKN